MENHTENSNDFLSQSYCQSIERITRTKDHIFNFQIPKKLLKIREEAWDDLFARYSKEMSDDIELNVDTLEPEEEEIEKEVSEEEYSCEHLARIPMRKPASLVQYWINTGNQPYKVLLDENDVSETGASLSEKEITLSSCLSVSSIINEGNKQTYKSESSYSSVNTAAYILSNANITNKADTVAIIKSVKCDKNINSSRNIKDVTVTYNNKSQFIENTRINCITNNDNSNVNNNIPDIELCSMSRECAGSKPCDQPTANIVTSGNTMQSDMYSQSEHTDQVDVLSISQRSLDIQDRNNIVRQFDEATKEWIGNYENNDDASNQDRILEKDIFYEKRMSENTAQKIITKDTNLTAFYRKKLYTGRNSPVDLIQTERHSINKLSGTKQSLHPALDSDCTTQRETLLVHKDKSKNSSLKKTNLNSKNTKRRKRSSIFNKNVTNTVDELSNNNSIQNNNLESSFKISSDYNNLDKQDDIPLLEYNGTNIFVRNKTHEQDLASFNMNPVVLLERIVPCFKQHESKSAKSNHITRKSNVHNYGDLNEPSKLYISEVENVDLQKIESDDSTILVCQYKTDAERTFPFSKESDCSFNLKLSDEHDSSAFNTEEKNCKLSSLKNTDDVSQNKESYNTSEKLSPRSEINKDCTNVRLREIKVIVERLPLSTMASQVSNKNSTVQQKNISSKSKTFSCNSHRTNELDNLERSREIKVILERLPASVNKSFTNTTMKTGIWNENDIHTQQKDVINKFKTHSFNTCAINRTNNVKLREIKIPLERLPPNICFNDTNISDVSQNKESYNTSEKLSPRSEINKDCTNVRLGEIKVIVERLPSSTMESQVSNKNSTVQQKNISSKSKTFSKNIISENTSFHNNKRKRQIKKVSKILARENVEASIPTVTKIDNNYSFRTHNKSKKNNDSKINDTPDVAKYEIFDKIESEFPIQYKNNSKANQDNRSKYSVLTFTSSDEDDFVRLIQRPKKRSKYKRIDDKLDKVNIIEKNLCDETKFVVPNKDEYHYSRNLKTVIFSSKEPETKRGTFELERKESREIKINSFDNTNTSLKMCENGKFLFTPNQNDNDSVTQNLDKRKRRASFLNYNKNVNDSNEVCSNAVMKRNEIIDHKSDTHDIFFQTKTFYSDSSNSEENNSYIAPTRKAYKNSFVHHKSQYHNNANLEEFFNNSIAAERYSRKSSSLLNSTFKKHDVDRKHDIKIGFVSTSKETKISKRLDNEECSDNINSKINNTREKMLPSCFINDTSIHTCKKMVSSNSFGKNNFSSFSKNEQISNNSKKSEAQQDDVKSAKLLMFQTKTYYDSDSNESL